MTDTARAVRTRKRQHQRAVRVCITLTPLLFDEAGRLIQRGGFVGLSDYLQDRIRRHSEELPDLSSKA